jgi:hypothetical protein
VVVVEVGVADGRRGARGERGGGELLLLQQQQRGSFGWQGERFAWESKIKTGGPEKEKRRGQPG